MKVLGIETSCDETAAAVVETAGDGLKMLSNEVSSSLDLHKAYGGVVPEIASRSHIESIVPVIRKALDESDSNWDKIDAIAVTQGPGLEGSLLVGVMTARTLAITCKKTLYAIDHVMAHTYASFIEQSPKFPLLALTVSGGHTQLALFEDHFKYKLLGRTLDDAVGEAFDKVAKILGLAYPGGPSIEKASKDGGSNAFQLPEPRLENPYQFSYSGLKTAVLRQAQECVGKKYDFPSHKLSPLLSDRQKADLAASFQNRALSILVKRLAKAADEFQPESIVIAGGVAASQQLRKLAEERINQDVIFPDRELCTDNAAMIAALGCFKVKLKQAASDPEKLSVAPGLNM